MQLAAAKKGAPAPFFILWGELAEEGKELRALGGSESRGHPLLVRRDPPFHLPELVSSALREPQTIAAPVFAPPPLDEPRVLERVDETHHGRAVYAERVRETALVHAGIRLDEEHEAHASGRERADVRGEVAEERLLRAAQAIPEEPRQHARFQWLANLLGPQTMSTIVVSLQARMQITLEGLEQPVPVESGDTILASLLRAGVVFPFSCQAGNCGTCKCQLVSGEVYELAYSEQALSPDERARGLILACRTQVWEDTVVRRLDTA